MKKDEVKVGRIYAARIDRRVVPVEILYGIERYGEPLCWIAKNLETDEEVEIKSAARLKYEMVRDADGSLRRA